MFDSCFSYMLLGLLIVILISNTKMTKNKNCLLLLLAGIAIIGIMLIDNYNNQDTQYLEGFNANTLAPVEKDINIQPSDTTISTTNLTQPTTQLLDGIQNNDKFDLNNVDFTLNVNPNDPKYNTNNNEPKKALQAKDLLPGIVTNSKDNFDSFTDLFNYDKALELDIAENKLGVDTIQQSKRNASQDLREAPICPKFLVSPWLNSTIQPDYNIKSLY